jgi:putative RNA 2'-phosphotransferase
MADALCVSKTLSYWLRHKPEAAALVLDAHGWADVDAVLGAFAQEGGGLDFEILLEVVESNEKQRFELSPDLSRIRARQGHSIAVELDAQALAPPAVLYHGTVERFLAAILVEGLRKMARHHVHLSGDLETARKVGGRRGAPIILEIDSAAMHRDGATFLLTSNQVWLAEHVPPQFLKKL